MTAGALTAAAARRLEDDGVRIPCNAFSAIARDDAAAHTLATGLFLTWDPGAASARLEVFSVDGRRRRHKTTLTLGQQALDMLVDGAVAVTGEMDRLFDADCRRPHPAFERYSRR